MCASRLKKGWLGTKVEQLLLGTCTLEYPIPNPIVSAEYRLVYFLIVLLIYKYRGVIYRAIRAEVHLGDERANATVLQHIPGSLFHAERSTAPAREKNDGTVYHSARTSEVWNFGWLLKVQPDRKPLEFVHGQLIQPSVKEARKNAILHNMRHGHDS